MAGLLSDVLPFLYSQGDRLKRQLGGLLSDPVGSVQQTLGGLLDSAAVQRELEARAFANQRRPFQVTDKQAMGQMADNMLAGPLSFAPVGMTAKFTYPQEQALETARQNAVKMLGLPENNTAMDRARALGFDAEGFHGTNRDFQAFSNDMLGVKTGAKSAQKAHFVASSPPTANSYVNLENLHALDNSPPVFEKLLKIPGAFDEFNAAQTAADKWSVLEKYGMNYGGGRVMPVMVRSGDQRVKDYKGAGYRDATYNDEIKAAKKGGKDSVLFKNTYDPGPHGVAGSTDVYAVMDPARLRSRFAAFDPARVNENDLLGKADPALLAALGIGTGAALTNEDLRKLLQSLTTP